VREGELFSDYLILWHLATDFVVRVADLPIAGSDDEITALYKV
jgi:hypothetical protein